MRFGKANRTPFGASARWISGTSRKYPNSKARSPNSPNDLGTIPRRAARRRSARRKGRIDPAGPHSAAEERAQVLAGAPRNRAVAARARQVGGRLVMRITPGSAAALSPAAEK